MESQITTTKQIHQFILAGKAHFTIVSKKTGARFSYLVSSSKDSNVWFVSVLIGPSNETDYKYMGIINANHTFRRTAKSYIREDAPSYIAFNWFWQMLQAKMEDGSLVGIDFYHSGRCGKCGKRLTVPESIESGLGPDCAEKLGLTGKWSKGNAYTKTLGHLAMMGA